jgi:hypothetical protein
VRRLVRRLLAATTARDARHRLYRFYDAVLTANMPKTAGAAV